MCTALMIFAILNIAVIAGAVCVVLYQDYKREQKKKHKTKAKAQGKVNSFVIQDPSIDCWHRELYH